MTKRLSLFIAVLLLLILIAAPYIGLPAHLQSLLYVIFFWISLATSWNLLSGYSGYFSFGHGAFFGLGMYGMATFATKVNLSFFPSVLLSGVVAALLALVIGALVFRLKSIRGESFALITLAVTFVLATLIVNTPIDGGPGVYLMGVSVPAIGPTAASSFYYLGLGMASLCVLCAYTLFYSKMGLGLLAIHDDEDVAEVNGVPTFALKMAAFALSSFLAGMMGSIHALYVSYVTVSETFNINVPLTVVLMSILGGARHWAGPTLGAILITVLLNAFTEGSSALVGRIVVGLILTLSVLLMPNGIWGSLSARFKAKKSNRDESVGAENTAHEHSKDLLTERKAELAQKGETPVGQKVVLEVKGLSKQFLAIKALGGVDLQLFEGEILGLLGPNGSGKSTFINVVTGHFAPTTGEVLLLGRDVAQLSAHEIRKAGISRTYQIPRPFNGLTVLQNVILSAQYGGQGGSEALAHEEALQWLEFTGLLDKAAELPDTLNLHQRKFLELARALAARPQVLLLDEVLSGLTPSEIDLAVQTIRLIRQRGTSIVFVEHVMSAVMALSDRLVVLDQGLVIASGSPKDVMNDPEVVRAYLGDKLEGE
jgi:branched-chain amino acid transport system permease protein